MPGSVINSCLLAELMSINCAFFVPASFFSDFSDFRGGSDFFPVAFVWLNAEPVATQIARNTTNRLALVLLFIVLNSFVGSLSTLTGRTLLHTSGDNFWLPSEQDSDLDPTRIRQAKANGGPSPGTCTYPKFRTLLKGSKWRRDDYLRHSDNQVRLGNNRVCRRNG